MTSTLLIGVIVAGVALLFCTIATATPYWWGNDVYNMGLFQICWHLKEYGELCERTIEDAAAWIEATAALMILSVLALTASLLLAILFGLVLTDKQIVALLASLLSFAAAVLTLLGVIIFGAKIPSEKMDDHTFREGSLRASFGLALAELFIAFVAGVLFFRSRTRNV